MADDARLDELVEALQGLRGPLARLVLARAERRRARGTPGERITTAQHLALSALAEGPLGTSELAARNGVAISTATRMIQGLERAGLVAPAAPADDDRRRRSVELTPAGREILGQADDALRARLRALLEPLPEDDRETILRAVSLVTGSLERQEAAAPDAAA
jgi:DNA-binding MarR family transcriptional regulator